MIKEANTFGKKKRWVEPKLWPLSKGVIIFTRFTLNRRNEFFTVKEGRTSHIHSTPLAPLPGQGIGSSGAAPTPSRAPLTLTSSLEFQEHRKPRHREAMERARGRTSRNRNTGAGRQEPRPRLTSRMGTRPAWKSFTMSLLALHENTGKPNSAESLTG